MKKSLPFVLFVCFGSIVFAGSANAQKHTAQALPDMDETHAAQAAAWLSHFINPMGIANYDSLKLLGYEQLRAMNNSAAMKVTSSAAWVEVGKSQDGVVSGRPSGIAFAPDGTIYLATNNGGLWKSVDNGQHWTSLSDSWNTLATGDVAVDPQNPNTVYAGTGIYFGNNTTIPGTINLSGVGVYKSIDGGLNWALLDSNALITTQMLVNPANSSIVYRATTGGIRRSSDGGQTWANVLSMNGPTSMVIDPNNASILYAAGGEQIKKSMDSGATWAALPSGYPTGALMTLAMSNSSSDTIYLSTGWGNGSISLSGSNRELGSGSTLALSTDAGKSWNAVSSNLDYLGQQAGYADAIAVNPTDPSIVVAGGLDIASSFQAGANMKLVTNWTVDPTSPIYTHADIHVLKYNPYTKVLFALTDGGIFYSANNGNNWNQSMNNTLGTFLFIGGDMAVDPNTNKPLFFAAGAQDNGLNWLAAGDRNYTGKVQGDGGTAYVSPSDNTTLYGTYIYADLYKSQDGGQTWGNGANLLAQTPILTSGENAPFYMEYAVADDNPNIIAVCGNRNLFLSTDGGSTYGADFPQVTNVGTGTTISGTVSTVHIASADDSYIYLGTQTGSFYTSADQAQSWTRSTTPVTFGGDITSIVTNPNDPSQVYLTTANIGQRHFWVSTDYGAHWTDPAQNLPNNLTYRRIAVDPNGIIYVGNDYTVLRSGDNGKTWFPVADGLPMAMVTSLRVRWPYLCATTYGRGMYYVNLSQLPPVPTSGVASGAPTVNSSIVISAVYPSIVNASAPQTTVKYSLASGNQATLAIYDALGRQERMLVNQYASQGSHEIHANLSGLAPGQHYLVLTSSGVSVTKPITVE